MSSKVAAINPSASALYQRKQSFSAKSFDNAKIASLIEDKTKDRQPIMEVIRLKLKKYFVTSTFGHIYTNVLLVLSVLSCLQYIIQTYFDRTDPKDEVRLCLCILLI
jgi:hypothetical protein